MWGDGLEAPKLHSGDRVAVLSPSFAAPGFAPAVHEQAMRRLTEATGLIPVEYPTTRQLGATPEARAADLNAAFADPAIRAILSTIGGDDQITVIPHLRADLARADPKIFLGYSDNTNLLNWLWAQRIGGFYGGSTQVHLGSGPGIDDIHLASLRAALMIGGELTIGNPGESEDFGRDWRDPSALLRYGDREPTEPWTWAGPARQVTGRTWGGCLEVIDQLALAGRIPRLEHLAGSILLLETSELIPPTDWVKRWVRGLGERGILSAVQGVLVARPPTSDFDSRPDSEQRSRLRADQRDTVIGEVSQYNPEAVICVGVPFGHTRPQWILPFGGMITLDGSHHTITAHYG
ncbi:MULTISPECIES: S66 peptidase family protein [unclassified Arthrobacter]|uniref:S66 family peptidase n=1 Tax=unclassified Arthrobacter TaxID=235627 RepID=UPI0018C90121|nr:S66 peptidase family protein [Arthrobacter sp. CAN_C5]